MLEQLQTQDLSLDTRVEFLQQMGLRDQIKQLKEMLVCLFVLFNCISTFLDYLIPNQLF